MDVTKITELTEHKLDRLQMLSKIVGTLSFGAFIVMLAFGLWQLSVIRENSKKIREQQEILQSLDPDILDMISRTTPEVFSSMPLVLIHIQPDGPRHLAEKLQNELRDKKYLVPPVQLVKKAPRVTEIRFCEGKGIQSDIDEIKELLTADNIQFTDLPPVTSFGCNNVTGKRRYELWLKNEVPAPQ